MIARQRINQARRMIENQHLAQAAAQKLPRQSRERNHMLLLALYSNLVANELVQPQITLEDSKTPQSMSKSADFKTEGGI